MLKRCLVLAVIGVLTLARVFADNPQTASAKPSAPQRTAEGVRQVEDQWLAALQAHDVSALQLILADEFHDWTYRGEQRDKAQAIEHARQGNPGVTSQRLEDVDVHVYGDTSVVHGTNVVEGQQFGTVRVRFTDVFVWRAKRWQAVAAQETLVSQTSPSS